MGELGELLELLDGAHARVSSLRVELRDWALSPASNELIVDREDLLAGRLRWRGHGPWPRTSKMRRRLWYVSPQRLRVEVMHDGELEGLGVRAGSSWWRWDREQGASTGEIEPAGGSRWLPPLLDPPLLTPARLVGSWRFEPAGDGLRAGRRVTRARARPRRPLPSRDEYSFEFEFDTEHGTVLRRAVFKDGDCVQESEAIEVSYDGPIDLERFVFDPPDNRATLRQAGLADAAPARLGRAPNGNGVRAAALRRPVPTVWLTGLSSAGKTTLARELERRLVVAGGAVCVLDGDELREGLSSDLGLSREDRDEQARRAAEVAALLSKSGTVAVVALVSPYEADRARARELHARLGLRFIEVWVDTPLEVCERRDPKALYARARAGELIELTGVDAPYEPPERPELRVSGDGEDPGGLADRILELLRAPGLAAAGATFERPADGPG